MSPDSNNDFLIEDEYELFLAVVEAIESRQKRNGLEVERYRFNLKSNP